MTMAYVKKHLIGWCSSGFSPGTFTTQLHVSFRFSSYTGAIAPLCRVKACINEIQTCMKNNKLQLNADRTEYFIVSTPNILPKISLWNRN